MAIEDTFGYRFVRMSLVLLNCLVLVRLISLLLQYSHVFDPTFVLFILLIGSNFMAAIVGAIREHRILVLVTGSLTLIMFLSLLFTNKQNKNLNVSLFTLLAIAAQSLIFSEMLKERQIFTQRQNLDLWNAATNSVTSQRRHSSTRNGPLTAVVVYQPSGANRGQTGGIFMVDPILGTELPKDPPPSYFAASCSPPKYEDAIKLNASNIVQPVQVAVTLPQVLPTSSSTATTISSSSSSSSTADDNNNNNVDTNSSNNNNNNNNQIRTTETISAAV
ncbi:hypothetical protein BLA29_005813, partial [Euroglyphus maynei]